MTRPVLLGGRTVTPASSFVRWFSFTWWPVLVMLTAIATESTHAFSSDNTSGWMRSVYQFFAGQVTDFSWQSIHHHIRKTGHFTGYGLLGLAFLRSWLLFWLQPMVRLPRAVWWRLCAALAVFCTMLAASLDELHQSFMPDRTGVLSDVLLDTSGAVALLLVCTVVAGTAAPRSIQHQEGVGMY